MRNLTFRGHAQRKGFQAIRVPDTSNKILQQAEQNLQGMRNVQKATVDQRNEMLRSMKSTADKEAVIRESNFNLSKQFAQAYRDAELQNIQTQMKQNEMDYKYKSIKRQEQQAAREQIKQLIPQTFKAFQQFDNQRWANAHKQAAEVQSRFGLTLEEASHAWKVHRTAEAVHSGTSALLQANGGRFSPEEALSISKLSGYQLLATQQLAAQQYGGDTYQLWFWKNAEKNWEGPDGKVNRSINQILRDETGINKQELSRAIRHWETEYISLEKRDKQGKPLTNPDGTPVKHLDSFSNTFITKYVRPGMHEFRETLLAEQNVRDEAYVKKDRLKGYRDTLKAAIKSPDGRPGENFLNWINVNSGNNPKARGDVRREGFRLVTQMAQSGEITEHEWDQIEAELVPLGENDKKPKSIRELYGPSGTNEIAAIRKAFTDRATKDRQLRKENEKNASDSMRMKVVQTASQLGRPLNYSEIGELKTWVSAQPGFNIQNNDWQWLTDYENTEELAIAESKRLLDGRVTSGGGLTMHELYSRPKYHPSHYKEYEKLTIDGPNKISSDSRKNFIGSIGSEVATKLETVIKTGDERGAQTKQMTAIAVELLQNNVKNALINAEYRTSLDAWTGESTKIIQRIQAGTGLFKLNTDATGEEILGKAGAGFEYLSTVKTQEKASAVRLKAEADKNIINTKGWLEDSQIEAIKSANPLLGKQVGGIPSFVWELDRVYPNKDPYDIMNTILVNHGEEEIIPPGGAKVSRFVHPAIRRLVTDSCSLSRTCRAVVDTVEVTDETADPIGTITDITRSKASTIDTEHGGADTVETSSGRTINGIDTGKRSFNKPINELNSQGIVDLWRQGRINKFGAWLHDGPTLIRHIEEGFVDPNEPFDIDVQRGIEIREIWDKAGVFREDGEALHGVGQAWVIDLPIVEESRWDATAELLALRGPFRAFQIRDELQPFIGGLVGGE